MLCMLCVVVVVVVAVVAVVVVVGVGVLVGEVVVVVVVDVVDVVVGDSAVVVVACFCVLFQPASCWRCGCGCYVLLLPSSLSLCVRSTPVTSPRNATRRPGVSKSLGRLENTWRPEKVFVKRVANPVRPPNSSIPTLRPTKAPNNVCP